MIKDSKIKLIECPRDAMQGIKDFIPTQTKVEYLNLLLKVGFHTLDFGSFVSPKAVPQLADTEEVILNLAESETKLLAIIANIKGAEKATSLSRIDYLGYPLSISEIFQKRNTNKTIASSLEELETIQNLCSKHNKTLVVYLSMAFGNPYGEVYDFQKIFELTGILSSMGVTIISLADTIGTSTPAQIRELYTSCVDEYSEVEWGLHLHTTPKDAENKLKAVKEAGCKRIDGALGGYGGCPFAQHDLVGNMPTETILDFFEPEYSPNSHLLRAMKYSKHVFF